MSKYIFNIFLLCIFMHSSYGQKDKFVPTSVRVGGELANFGYSLFKDEFKSWELEADIDFHRYFLVADWGYSSYNQNTEYFDYRSQGHYFRVGPDINFIRRKNTNDVLALGMRYGRTTFNENAVYSSYNAIENITPFPAQEIVYNEDKITGQWFEFDASLKASIYKNLFLGFTVRYKILPRTRKEGSFKTYYIPGFGRIINENNWGISYYVFYRIPFRKKKELLLKDKISK